MGVISTGVIIALLAFVVWLAGSKFSRDYDLYDIVFQGPVRGLAQGGEVHFNGIKVGEVSKISLDPHNPQLVIARARVTSDVPIRKDSYASLEPQGITGVNYVQITAGTATKPLLRDTVPDGVVPRMMSKKDALSDLLAGGGDVLQRTVEALDRVNRLLSDQNIKTFGASLSDIQALTAELRERKEIIADAQKTLQSADQAMQQIRDLAKSSNGLVNGDAKRTLAKLADTAEEAQGAMKDVRALTARLAGPTTDFATNGLPALTQAISGLQRTTENLDRVLNEVQTDPQGSRRQAQGQGDRDQAMTRLAPKAAVVVLFAMTLGGCISLFPKVKPAQLYRFGTVTPAARPVATSAREVLRLAPIGFVTAAAGDRILTTDGEQAAYLAGGRWVSPAAVLFESALVQTFDARPGPARLVARGELAPSPYALKLDVRRFEARYESGPAAAPTVVVEVYAALDNPGLPARDREKIFTVRVTAADNRLAPIATAYDNAVAQVCAQVVDWVNAGS